MRARVPLALPSGMEFAHRNERLQSFAEALVSVILSAAMGVGSDDLPALRFQTQRQGDGAANMNDATMGPCPIDNRDARWLSQCIGRQFQRLCAIAFALTVAVNGAAVAAPSGPSMGPLSEFLFEGNDGKWQGAIRDDSFIISNQTDPDAIFYLYTKAGLAGAREIRVQVKAQWGQSSRVGLLYGFQPEGPVYYPLVIEESGRQVSLLRRGKDGLEPRMSSSLENSRKKDGWHELLIVESKSKIEWSLDGQSMGSMGDSELGRGFVGIVAMGTGRFAFRGFAVRDTGVSHRQAMPQGQSAAKKVNPASPAVAKGKASEPASRQVQIMDQAFNMPIWRESIPADWEVFQQVATDVNKGGYTVYLRDVYGPRGELIRDLGSSIYNNALGVSAEMIIQAAIASAVEQPSIGPIGPSKVMESLPLVTFKRRSQQMESRSLDTYEVPFAGLQKGQRVQGVLYLMNTPYPQLGNAGYMEIALVTSPPEHFAQTLRINQGVLRSRDLSGDYLARKHQHNQEAGQRGQAAHQQRMAQLEANHAAHQSRMRDVYAASDARHEAWMNTNVRAQSSGGNYDNQDAFIDQIYERTSFNDPYSGQEIKVDGQREQWYSNGLGDYYGTDNPSFNQHSLQGDWQATDPSRPGGR